MKKLRMFVFMFVLSFALVIPAAAVDDAYLTRGRLCTELAEKLQLDMEDVPEESPFSDVNVTDDNYAAIMACCKAGLMSGTSVNQFQPNTAMTRAIVAVVLCRAEMGVAPGVDPGITVPEDVEEGSWYHDSVCSVLASGAMSVREDGKFYPSETAKESDVNWGVPSESYVVNKGSETLRFDLTQGSIRIYANMSGKLRYQQGNGDIVASTGSVIVQQSNSGIATENTITVESGEAKLSINGLNVSSQTSSISVKSGASLELTLLGNNTLVGKCGIFVPKEAELIVKGAGVVSTTGNPGAGIGAAYSTIVVNGGIAITGGNTGTITINSGTVIATGGNLGAGIGGGEEGDGGSITINGGTVTAAGGDYGAGIGGGRGGAGGIITINGGAVTATGGKYSGAGIGGGKHGGIITINGGTVTATGGDYGAGIGGGNYGGGGIITINGGIVTATGGKYSGAGIGGGEYGGGGNITISGGEITAEGRYCALGGDSPSNNYGCDAISIAPSATVHLSYINKNGTNCIEKITLLSQLIDSTALSGHNVQFVADAYGFSGLAYQWQISMDGTTWSDLTGETASIGKIPVTAETDGAFVRCKLTNGWGNVVYTNTAKVYALAFSQQPEDVKVGAGENVMLSAASTCANVTYQWQRSVDGGASWANIDGECYADLILSGALGDNGLYRCVITATNGDELASNTATVTVTDPNAPITYTTIYYQQNADGKTYTAYEQSISGGAAGSTVTAPQKSYPHYTENTAKGVMSGTVAADGSLVLSRYYDRDRYTISFDTKGGSAETPITAIHGAAVTAPSDPSRLGYTFDGWYSDEGLKTPYPFTVMPAEDITVYAKWTPVGAGRGTEYQIAGIQLRDSAYQPISKAPKGIFYAEVSVKNLSSHTMDVLVLAAYDAKGKMLDMKFLYADPMIGQTFTLGASMDNSGGTIAVIKAFMLPTLGGLVPLAEAVEYQC